MLFYETCIQVTISEGYDEWVHPSQGWAVCPLLQGLFCVSSLRIKPSEWWPDWEMECWHGWTPVVQWLTGECMWFCVQLGCPQDGSWGPCPHLHPSLWLPYGLHMPHFQARCLDGWGGSRSVSHQISVTVLQWVATRRWKAEGIILQVAWWQDKLSCHFFCKSQLPLLGLFSMYRLCGQKWAFASLPHGLLASWQS
jgi:hypothetical protein